MSCHHHGPDCDCGCHSHGDAAHALAEGALVCSRVWSGTEGSPAELETRAVHGLESLAALLAEDGIILGHLKTLVRWGEGALALSVTRADTMDRTPVGGWPPATADGSWSLTVNVLSLGSVPVTVAELDRLFGQ